MTDSMEADFDPDPDLTVADLPVDALDGSDENPDETLLDQLDRRQNTVLKKLDELDARIQALVQQCQNQRSPAA